VRMQQPLQPAQPLQPWRREQALVPREVREPLYLRTQDWPVRLLDMPAKVISRLSPRLQMQRPLQRQLRLHLQAPAPKPLSRLVSTPISITGRSTESRPIKVSSIKAPTTTPRIRPRSPRKNKDRVEPRLTRPARRKSLKQLPPLQRPATMARSRTPRKLNHRVLPPHPRAPSRAPSRSLRAPDRPQPPLPQK